MANKPVELLSVGSDRSPARAREDYVKAIYQLGRGEPVRAAALARYLNVSRVSVSKAKRLLEAEGLLESTRSPSQPLHLSARGERLAVAMVRRHRVLETFLHRTLHVPLERIHAEAERIEHVISDDVALRIASLLGHPRWDPHGHPIPYGDTIARREPQPSLETLAAGSKARVLSLDDRDDTAVAAIAAAGLLPGSALRVERVERDRIFVRLGRRLVAVRRAHAAMVRVGG
ncbi:MAG TPA: metal-dependent transcriptional regulator [Candidatus Cybelea sp.]|jgi:DtxR family Mn-dependent transcriptional regulator|nr:metal-dependent transcriptional regulator [Candidatus Cybelea sp.]